jgi:hypothetical protein
MLLRTTCDLPCVSKVQVAELIMAASLFDLLSSLCTDLLEIASNDLFRDVLSLWVTLCSLYSLFPQTPVKNLVACYRTFCQF